MHVSVETVILSTVYIKPLISGYRAPSVPASFVNVCKEYCCFSLSCISRWQFQFCRIGLKNNCYSGNNVSVNLHLFPSQWGGYTKNKTTDQISRLVQRNQSNCRKTKDKEYQVANFATFVSKTLISPPPQKWMNFISNRLSTASIKYLNWTSPVSKRFQNGCNKVVIEPRVVQFWSEVMLVISNHAYDLSPNCTLLSSITIIYHR